MSNSDQDTDGAQLQGPTAALEALEEASREPDILTDYRTIAAAFAPEDYRQIVDLAWRHQFNAERLNFKRDIRELQKHVCSRITLAQESDE